MCPIPKAVWWLSATLPGLRLQEAQARPRQGQSRGPEGPSSMAYKKLKENKGEDDPIYFMDATHPRHNPVLAYGWIKRDEDRNIPRNTGRRRVNINGGIDLERLEPIVRFDGSINADSTIALFKPIKALNPAATAIPVICDNARDYRSKAP